MTGFAGGCHCGNMRYEFFPTGEPAAWPVRRCTCSHCVRFGARYTSGPGARLDLTVQHESLLHRYQFGTRTAEFLRCGDCGVMLLAAAEADARQIAVLNVNTLDNCETLGFEVRDAHFDDEPLEERLQRRARNWIPEVSIHYVNP